MFLIVIVLWISCFLHYQILSPGLGRLINWIHEHFHDAPCLWIWMWKSKNLPCHTFLKIVRISQFCTVLMELHTCRNLSTVMVNLLWLFATSVCASLSHKLPIKLGIWFLSIRIVSPRQLLPVAGCAGPYNNWSKTMNNAKLSFKPRHQNTHLCASQYIWLDALLLSGAFHLRTSSRWNDFCILMSIQSKNSRELPTVKDNNNCL